MSTAWLKSLIDQNDRAGFSRALENPMLRSFAAGNVGTDGNLLHAAIRAGWEEAIAPLITAGADINARDARAETVLHLAAGAGMAAGTKTLIAAGADIHARAGVPDSAQPPAGWGDTPLHRAVDSGNADCLRALLDAGAAAFIFVPTNFRKRRVLRTVATRRPSRS